MSLPAQPERQELKQLLPLQISGEFLSNVAVGASGCVQFLSKNSSQNLE